MHTASLRPSLPLVAIPAVLALAACSEDVLIIAAGDAAEDATGLPAITLDVGEALDLRANRVRGDVVVDEYDQATWTSADTAVATVDAAGLVRAVAPGTTTVRAADVTLEPPFTVTTADTIEVTVRASTSPADLSLTCAAPAAALVGGVAEVACAVASDGAAADDVEVTLTVPPGVDVVAAASSDSAGTSVVEDRPGGGFVVVWQAALQDEAGQRALEVTLEVVATAAGAYALEGVVAHADGTPDGNAANDAATVTLDVDVAPAGSLAVRVDAPVPSDANTVALAGEPQRVHAELENLGGALVAGARLVLSFDTDVAIDAPPAGCTFAETLTCVADIDAGATTEIDVEVTPLSGGDYAVSATWVAPVNDPDTSDDVANASGAARTIASVEVTPDAPAVLVGGALQLRAIATLDDGTADVDVTANVSVSWSSQDVNVATVANAGAKKGLVTGLSEGGAEVLFAHVPSGASASTIVDVVDAGAAGVCLAIASAEPAGGVATVRLLGDGTFGDVQLGGGGAFASATTMLRPEGTVLVSVSPGVDASSESTLHAALVDPEDCSQTALDTVTMPRGYAYVAAIGDRVYVGRQRDGGGILGFDFDGATFTPNAAATTATDNFTLLALFAHPTEARLAGIVGEDIVSYDVGADGALTETDATRAGGLSTTKADVAPDGAHVCGFALSPRQLFCIPWSGGVFLDADVVTEPLAQFSTDLDIASLAAGEEVVFQVVSGDNGTLLRAEVLDGDDLFAAPGSPRGLSQADHLVAVPELGVVVVLVGLGYVPVPYDPETGALGDPGAALEPDFFPFGAFVVPFE